MAIASQRQNAGNIYCFHAYAASNVWRPEAAVLTGTNRPFDLRPAVVGLFRNRLLQLNVFPVMVDTVFNPVFDLE